MFLPVLAGVSEAGNFHPFLLMVPATIAASCAFMLPSGTGPNASVLASGQLTIPQNGKSRVRFKFYCNHIYLFSIPFYIVSFSEHKINKWAYCGIIVSRLKKIK